jgi:PAT family acetyl-CoA transporter-like MFS transporter 1
MLDQLEVTGLAGFMFYTGFVFILVTVVVAAVKPEEPLKDGEQPEGVLEAYRSIIMMLQLKPIRTLIIVLFTWKFAFAVVDSVAPLKFQEYGVTKEYMTYMGSALMPLEILLPIVASPWTAGPRPFNLAMYVYPWKVATVPITALLAYYTPSMDPFPWNFWAAMIIVATVGSITTESMFVSQIALFARVSDPKIGGTYMSFLNTVANLGQKLPPTATFFLVDHLTCSDEACLLQADGFYVMTALCTAVGIAWYIIAARPVRQMQERNLLEWRVGADKKD